MGHKFFPSIIYKSYCPQLIFERAHASYFIREYPRFCLECHLSSILFTQWSVYFLVTATVILKLIMLVCTPVCSMRTPAALSNTKATSIARARILCAFKFHSNRQCCVSSAHALLIDSSSTLLPAVWLTRQCLIISTECSKTTVLARITHPSQS